LSNGAYVNPLIKLLNDNFEGSSNRFVVKISPFGVNADLNAQTKGTKTSDAKIKSKEWFIMAKSNFFLIFIRSLPD
jgi:hypothetical protein